MDGVFAIDKSCGAAVLGGVLDAYDVSPWLSSSCMFVKLVKDSLKPSGSLVNSVGCAEIENGFRNTATDGTALTIPCTHFGTV